MTSQSTVTQFPKSPDPGPQSGNDGETEIELGSLFRTARRRKWWLLGSVVMSLLIGTVVATGAPRVYRATAKLVIDQNAPDVLSGVNEVYGLGTKGFWTTQQYYHTQYQIIKSRGVAEIAAQSLGLSPTSLAQQLRQAEPTSARAQAAGRPLDGLSSDLKKQLIFLGFKDAESREAILAGLEKVDIAGRVSGSVIVKAIPDSHLVEIAVEGADPELVTHLANAVADAYQDFNVEQKLSMTRSAVDWLSDQKRELKRKLDDSEVALQAFKRDHNIVSVSMEDRQNMINDTLSRLNAEYSAAKSERISLESKRQHIGSIRSGKIPPEALEVISSSAVVQQLKSTQSALKQTATEMSVKYTAEHPKLAMITRKLELVEKELASEIEALLLSLDTRYATVRDNERRLKLAIDEVKQEAFDLNDKEIEYTRLKRERDNNESLYDLVLKRHKEADLTQMLKINNIRKLEAARVPKGSIRPNVKVYLILALMLGILLGVTLIFAVDYLDNTIKSHEQLERFGLAFLGVLPAIEEDLGGASNEEPAERDRYIVGHTRSSVAECARTIRTNLMFMSPDRPLNRLLVTSSSPREGKSTTAVNLAITMALSGAETLLVDTDLRKPRLHKSFPSKGDEGITTAIINGASLESVVTPTDIENLDVLRCGPVPPNPSELLHTRRFVEIVEEASRRYDRVIFDSPPVGAVADPLVLANIVDGVLLVVKANATTWQSVRDAMRRLAPVRANVLGAILNDVELNKDGYGRYYSGYYYYRSYGEEPEEKRASQA